MAEDHPICHMEAVNAVAAIQTWASTIHGCLVHLHTDNAMAAAIFRLDKARDAYIIYKLVLMNYG